MNASRFILGPSLPVAGVRPAFAFATLMTGAAGI